MTDHDSTQQTLDHIHEVKLLIDFVIQELMLRAIRHDASKLQAPEKAYFDLHTPVLSGLIYGSREYEENQARMKPAIDHHQMHNRHHPEYHGDRGVLGMDLVDLVEMICDWKAATRRNAGGDIRKSLEIGMARFNMPPALVEILENTIENMGW